MPVDAESSQIETHWMDLLTSGKAIGASAIVAGMAFSVWALLESSGISSVVITITCWVSSPYLLIFLASHWISTTPAKVILALTTAVTVIFGMWAYGYVDEDAQGGLVLLFAPFYQLVGVSLLSILALIVNRFTRRRRLVQAT